MHVEPGEGHAPDPTSWTWEPDLLIGLGLAAGLYAAGWKWVPQEERSQLAPWRAWCFGAGLLAVATALLSPISTLSGALLFMHMNQHMLLLLSAPLLLLGNPLLPVRWALPAPARLWLERLFARGQPLERLFYFFTHPAVAALLYVGAIGIWHLPTYYDAALGNGLLHEIEHLFFLGTSILFWWTVVYDGGERRRLGYGIGVLYLAAPMLEGNAIGAVLTFASQPLFSTYAEAPRLWGFSVMQDQQLAGLIMWVPGSLLYVIPMILFLTRMVQKEEREARAMEAAASIAPAHSERPRSSNAGSAPR